MDSQAAVILAAGQGSRMKSRLPKALHRVCGKEMVSFVLDAVKGAGFEKVIVVTSSTSNELRSLLGSSVNFVEQSEQLGTGHALLQAKSALDGVDQVLVIGTDTPLVKPDLNTPTCDEILRPAREETVHVSRSQQIGHKM